MFFGIYFFFSPVIEAAAWIPLVGYLLSNGIAIAVFVFAIVLAGTLTFSTITVAWLYYRPLYGMIFLAFAVAGFSLLFLIP